MLFVADHRTWLLNQTRSFKKTAKDAEDDAMAINSLSASKSPGERAWWNGGRRGWVVLGCGGKIGTEDRVRERKEEATTKAPSRVAQAQDSWPSARRAFYELLPCQGTFAGPQTCAALPSKILSGLHLEKRNLHCSRSWSSIIKFGGRTTHPPSPLCCYLPTLN